MLASKTNQAVELMMRFAERTGLTSARPPRRYLWTDAFAVCNFVALSRVTGEGRYTELALRLVEQVHAVLGRHRADDARTGWLSGLGPQEGEAHPTCGGLRIGKPLPERGPAEPVDDRLEWERDGQYFHYLTKWMHALDQLARATEQTLFNVWARELAEAAHRGFVYVPSGGGGKRMCWKASIDLSRPQVASMGQHDPLDGFVTCTQLEATAARMRPSAAGPSLAAVVADFAGMLDSRQLATRDPLGLGGLLVDAYRIDQLTRQRAWSRDDGLLEALLVAALAGLRAYLADGDLRLPADRRLPFRELGLAIGVAAVTLMEGDARAAPAGSASPGPVHARLEQLSRYAPLRADIEAFWLPAERRRGHTWLDHEDINDVMLATTLAPEGFLVLRPR